MEFQREELLIGDKINVLKSKTVLVLGLGGVGGYTVEALVRAGIGNIILVDYDTVDITNINRQIIALHSNIGRKKTECFKERINDINPNCHVKVFDIFYSKENKDIIFQDKIDYVIDCCDSLDSKKILIEESQFRNIPIISSMGTGNKLHPEMFKITKLKKTAYDPLAKILRKYVMDKKTNKKIMVVSSTEEPIRKDMLASMIFVPSVAGILCANYIIRDIIEK